MRRRSLRLLRPNPILNSDGETEEFFRVKIIVDNFLLENLWA